MTPGRDSEILPTRKHRDTPFLRFRKTNRNQGVKYSPNKDRPDINTYNYTHPKLRHAHRFQHEDTITTRKCSSSRVQHPHHSGPEKCNIAESWVKYFKIGITKFFKDFKEVMIKYINEIFWRHKQSNEMKKTVQGMRLKWNHQRKPKLRENFRNSNRKLRVKAPQQNTRVEERIISGTKDKIRNGYFSKRKS